MASMLLMALSRHEEVAYSKKAPAKPPGAFDGALLVLRHCPTA